eukprot:NODE_22_length_42145_cov_1.310612.p34 type:complete len:108 gc:universal NODE_22_length_42145_cov_1.310612:13484-13161(-)
MTMAGPRQRQRIAVDPNNQRWNTKNSVAHNYLKKYNVDQMKSSQVRLKKKMNSDGIGHQIFKETASYLSDLDSLFTKNKKEDGNKSGMNNQKLSIEQYFERKKRGIV